MVEWSRPRSTPFAGHRKATLHYCLACEQYHKTHRHVDGEERCPRMADVQPIDFPAIIERRMVSQ